MSSPTNLLLESLSDESKSALIGQFEHVELPLRTVLFDTDETPRFVHFMTSGIASMVTTMGGGEAVEVGPYVQQRTDGHTLQLLYFLDERTQTAQTLSQ